MKDIEKLKGKHELYFLDIETINHKDIVQIGITRLKKKDLEARVLFDEIINPKTQKKDINRFASSVHFVSEHQWSSASEIHIHHSHLRKLLEGKSVCHWGGDDCKKLNNFLVDRMLPPIIMEEIDLLKYYDNQESLESSCKRYGLENAAFHDASFDSFATSLLFILDFLKLPLKEPHIKELRNYNQKFKQAKGRFKISEIKQGSGAKGTVCLSGLSKLEKIEISNKLADLGYQIRSAVTSKTDYLIIPSLDYSGSPTKLAKAKEFGVEIKTPEKFFLQT